MLFDKNSAFLNKRIGILGLGKEGISAAKFFHGKSKVTLLEDKKKDQLETRFNNETELIKCPKFFGGHFPHSLQFDYLIRSPGVRPDHAFIQSQIKKNAIITSPTALFFELCPCPIISVTGTKGKGTTATLIYEFLKTESKNVYLAGNIGTPALEILPKLNKRSLAVLELSSFQLIDLKKSPHIAVVLMVTSEHLDWHTSLQEYVNAKIPIAAFQETGDFKVINADFANSIKIGSLGKGRAIFYSTKKKTNGLYLVKNRIISALSAKPETIAETERILLPGAHNLQNVMAAATVAKILQVKTENIKKVLSAFKGLPYRLQLVGEKNGIKFYNDSFSTTPETTIAAINSFSSPKIIILGGSSKNSDFSALAAEIVADKSLKAIILIGKEAKRIESNIKKTGKFEGKVIEGLTTMRQIVAQAASLSKKGCVVILSPACASFDMFKNYEERGDKFTQAVLKIIK